MLTRLERQDDLVVKKHVNAIHCWNNFTLLQRKVWDVLLWSAYEDLKDYSVFKIPIKTLCELIGYTSNDYTTLKNSLKQLMQTIVEWDVIHWSNETTSAWNASTAIAAVRFDRGICIYEYSNLMRSVLHNPERYGRIDLRTLPYFDSNYGLALYENAIVQQDLPHKQSRWMTAKEFRKIMGVSDKSYQALCDFKKRVITVGVADFNKNPYISYKLECEIKEYFGENQFKLKLYPKCEEIPVYSEKKIGEEKTNIQRLLVERIGCSQSIAESVCSQYEPEYILEKFKLFTTSHSFITGNVKNPTGYFLAALKKNYQLTKTNQGSKCDDEHKKIIDKTEVQRTALKTKEYFDYLKKRINELFQNISEKEKEVLSNSFIDYLNENSFYNLADLYKKFGYQKYDDVTHKMVIFIVGREDKYNNYFLKFNEFHSLQ